MYYVYLLECADRSLYCGYTNNIVQREKKHNDGKGAKYTASRLPVCVVYTESYNYKSDALKRECAIKKLTRSEKLELINKSTATEYNI